MERKRKYIFIIGIDWPPTTFIMRKLKALTESNEFNIIAGISSPRKRTDFTLKFPSVKLVKLSHTDDPIISRILILFINILKLLIKSPKKLFQLITIARQNSGNLKAFFNLLIDYSTIALQQFDIAHFEWAISAYKYLPLLRYLKKPYTISARGRQFTIEPLINENYRERLKEVLTYAKAVHCVSKSLAEETKKIYKNSNTVIIYNGVDLGMFKCNSDKKSRGLNVIFIGSLIWRKSVDSAIYIFYRYFKLGGQGQMFIIGDGEEKQKMYSTINNLHLSDKVKYLGKKNEQEVAQILQNMDVLLLPSFAEGLANVILEAMATCTVPIVSDVHGNSEPIIHGKTGFLFPLLALDKPAKYLYHLYTHPKTLREIKEQARKGVEEAFTLQHMQEGHVKFYERLLL